MLLRSCFGFNSAIKDKTLHCVKNFDDFFSQQKKNVGLYSLIWAAVRISFSNRHFVRIGIIYFGDDSLRFDTRFDGFNRNEAKHA